MCGFFTPVLNTPSIHKMFYHAKHHEILHPVLLPEVLRCWSLGFLLPCSYNGDEWNLSLQYVVLKTLEMTCEKQQCIFPEQCPGFFGLSADLTVDRLLSTRELVLSKQEVVHFCAVSRTKKKEITSVVFMQWHNFQRRMSENLSTSK